MGSSNALKYKGILRSRNGRKNKKQEWPNLALDGQPGEENALEWKLLA